MVKVHDIGSTYSPKTTAMGLQNSAIDASLLGSFQFQLFSPSHSFVMQRTSAKHWNRKKGTTSHSPD